MGRGPPEAGGPSHWESGVLHFTWTPGIKARSLCK